MAMASFSRQSSASLAAYGTNRLIVVVDGKGSGVAYVLLAEREDQRLPLRKQNQDLPSSKHLLTFRCL